MPSSQPSVPAEDRLDLIFHALSDRTRRALIGRLLEGPAKITELAKPFDMSLPAVSKHLRVLERAGLVNRTVSGRIHHCAIGVAPLDEIELWLSRTRAFWTERLAGLADYVESNADLDIQPEDEK